LRAALLSLYVIIIVLSLSTGTFIPQAFVSHPNEYSHLSAFPQPLLSVNDSQSTEQHVQVGAWGNGDSVGNEGVQVEIQTNSYNVSSQAEDAFWVGDVLNNGAFVQFGYVILSPGYYCLSAHVTGNGTDCSGIDDTVGFSDARWFWAYFPNVQVVSDWYYGFGPGNSAGLNSTWHLYSILPSASAAWSFQMDGVTVYSTNFPSATSTTPAHVVAEKASGSYLSQLGPVEFRNLAYLGNDTLWHGTSSLTSIDGCGYGDRLPCNMAISYGVVSVGANAIVAGSNVSTPLGDQPLWLRQSLCSMHTVLADAESGGTAPLNVTFTESVFASRGDVSTDWWFGDGSHHQGNSSQTVTYRTPGNYTPMVRVVDSAGCLSEATGEVSVTPPSTGSSIGTFTVWPFSFAFKVTEVAAVAPTVLLRKVRL
jgi:hypothetical protein